MTTSIPSDNEDSAPSTVIDFVSQANPDSWQHLSRIAQFHSQNYYISTRGLTVSLLNEQYLDLLISSSTTLLQNADAPEEKERLAGLLLFAAEKLTQISLTDSHAISFDKVSMGALAAHYMERPFTASDVLAQSYAVQAAYALGSLIDTIRENSRQILLLDLSPRTPRGISLAKALGEEAEINTSTVKRQMLRACKQVFARTAPAMGSLKPADEADMSAILRTVKDRLGGLSWPKTMPTANKFAKVLLS